MKKKSNRTLSKTPPEGFPSRMVDLINHLKVEQQHLAEIGGVTPPTITAYINGTSQPSAGILSKWVQFYRVNANWLLTGEGPMFQPAPGDASHPQPSPEETLLEREMRAIEDRLTRLGAEKREVVEALKAHLGVAAAATLAGRCPGPTARDRGRGPGRSQSPEDRGTAADQENPVKD